MPPTTTVKWPINETTKMTYSFCCVVLNLCIKFGSNISKTSASVSSGFQTRELMKARGRRPSAFIVFEQQKIISLNYHLNKVSQFNYYI